MNFYVRKKLVDALLKCSSVESREIRDDIVSNLPQHIRTGILRRSMDRADVMNILKSVSEYRNGLGEFHIPLQAYYNRGRIYFEQREYVEALQDFLEALQLNREYVDLYEKIEICEHKIELNQQKINRIES